MECPACAQQYSIKNTKDYISLLCRCGIFIIYPKRNTVFVSKEQYRKNESIRKNH